jgi:hypothetical protein
MPCALCVLGFELHPLHDCVPSPSSAFETPLPLQPLLSFNHELFFLFLPPLPTHCRSRGLLLHMITLRHTILGRTSLDEGSARRRDLYLTTHNTQKRQASIPPVECEPAIAASKRPQTVRPPIIYSLCLNTLGMEQIKANCKKRDFHANGLL